jgi:hypothetical protein
MPAQPPGAPYDYWKERDFVLQGNLGRKFSECSNEMIVEIYGQCSEHDHNLQALLANREQTESWIDSVEMLPGQKHECRPLKLKFKTVSTVCHRCETRVRYKAQAHRIVAIYKEADWNLWMGVVTVAGSATVKLFHASAFCNIYQGDNHCAHVDHLLLETAVQNAWRAGNHSGTYGCFCPIPCIGEYVQRGVLTHEERKVLKTANYVFPHMHY